MQKRRKKTNKIFLISMIILFVLLLIISAILKSQEKNIEQEEITYEDISNVQQVLIYYRCTYISEKTSEIEGFYEDIRLVFAKKLYDGDESNEEFFTNVINDVAKVLNYNNFRMIDDTNDIEVKVYCENDAIEDIEINDIYDYFIYMDSQIELKNFEEIKTTELSSNSEELTALINSNWNSSQNFGTRESIFENYNIYFDEGIETRTINGKIYNIIFNKNYSKSVVNDLFPGIDLKDVKQKLGEPTFEDEELNVIGYKGENYYAFFTDEQISIYRRDKSDTDDFFKLIDKFLNEELDLLDFMNELTYLWPDYSEYDYDSNYVFLSYPLKGVDIKINYDETNGIVLYNNVNATYSKLEEYLENIEFTAKLKLDNVFEAEKRRVEAKQNLLQTCEEYIENKSEEDQELIGESLKFGVYAEETDSESIIKLCFVSRDGTYPNRELNDNIYTFLWLDSDILIYSQNKVGIFYYNVLTGEKNTLVTGSEAYTLKSFKDGVLEYDDSELNIVY